MSAKGHFRCYVPRNFREETLAVIKTANQIIEEFESQGFSMTLRQLHYQFVARGLGENSDRAYDRLGEVISDARLAGLVSWTAIEDRTRYTRDLQYHNSPADILRSAKESYRRDLWADQPFRPVVGVEKDAMIGVVSDVCYELRVPFCSFRGYSSQSQQWRLGQQLAGYVQDGQQPIVFHLGDHDPDGVDMTRDIRERLSLFAGQPVNVVRLALNMDQVNRYQPPPNPARQKSARYATYAARFGEYSWELDALAPTVIRDLIDSAVRRIKDEPRWDAALAEEARDRDRLDEIVESLS